MTFFTRQRRTFLLAVIIVAAFVSGALAQTEEALIPFVVNVDADVSVSGSYSSNSVRVMANQETVLSIYVPVTTGIVNGVQRQINTPTITNNRNGKVSINLPAQSHKSAEVLLYTVHGKRVLHSNVSTSNNITHPNLATGVYVLSVRGNEGNIITSRLTHNGGGLNINVAFGNDVSSSNKHLAKKTDALCNITVRSIVTGYVDSVYTLNIQPGQNPRQNITLHGGKATVPLNVSATVVGIDKITVTWSRVSGVKGYFVYCRIGASGEYTSVGVTDSTYTSTGLAIGTTCYYKVSSYNVEGDESPLSEEVSATIPPITKITGTFTDSRDNKKYKTATIDGKTWMAENLNYDPQKGNTWCYENSPDSCNKYGRLYDWATAMNINTNFNTATLGGSDVNRQCVCPAGWHLPSYGEKVSLLAYVGGSMTAGKRLKSTSGWKDNGNGTDNFGFSTLPSGGRYFQYCEDEFCGTNGWDGNWWTATEGNTDNAYVMRIHYDNYYGEIEVTSMLKINGFSVRCVQND